jgi:trans-aconitate methyltransferase
MSVECEFYRNSSKAYGEFQPSEELGVDYSEQFDGWIYERNSDPQYFWASKMIERMEGSQENLSILDVGCGEGRITDTILKDKFPQAHFTGLDPSAGMLNRARARKCSTLWLEASVEDFNLRSQYEIVTSFSALHWVKEIDVALSKIYGALKAQGKAYFVLAAKTQASVFDSSLEEQISSSKWSPLFAQGNISSWSQSIFERSAKEFEKSLISAGFSVLVNQVEELTYTFESRQKFKQWIDAACPYKTILKKRNGEFLDDFLDSYSNSVPPNVNGSIDYKEYLLFSIVEK